MCDGVGIVTLARCFATDAMNLKSSVTMDLARFIGPAVSGAGDGVENRVIAEDDFEPRNSKPSTALRKPRDQPARRNSPSVTIGKPSFSCIATASRMLSSCTRRSLFRRQLAIFPGAPGLHQFRRPLEAADVINCVGRES